jgi:NADPH:quinone reductase-like Zn-dependent oxidoreductase
MSDPTPQTVPGQALRIVRKAVDAQDIAPDLVPLDLPEAPPGHAVVRIRAAAVNPSDVKAALGLMPQAVWPRTPGRDFAGTVVAGPARWIGFDVWGTGGDLGITRDGSHASYLVLPVEALARKPASVSMAAAATVGVPFITAHEGLRRAQLRGPRQTVVVFGAHGKVGQAAIQLAARAGADVIAVDREREVYAGHAAAPVRMVRGSGDTLGAAVLAATGARGADIAFNTVGSPYFAAALECLAVGGTQVLISTIERSVPFDILPFYRRNLQMLGVDSLKLAASDCARILDSLQPGFDDGTLKAFDVDEATLVPLSDAADAYRRVLAGARERVVLAP